MAIEIYWQLKRGLFFISVVCCSVKNTNSDCYSPNTISKERNTTAAAILQQQPVSYTHLDVYKRQAYKKLFIVQPEGECKRGKKGLIVIKCIRFRKPLDLFFLFVNVNIFISKYGNSVW